MAFNPNQHLVKLKGQEYLEVKWRMVWFREQCPQGSIETEMLRLDSEKGLAVFKAIVTDGNGGIGQGHGSETAKDFGDFIEKAETKAIGRALAALGYGTQFAPELDEGTRLVDSLVDRGRKPVLPSKEDLYERGAAKGMWRSGSEFYAAVSHILGCIVAKDTWGNLPREQVEVVIAAIDSRV